MNIDSEIKKMIELNKLNDLRRFLNKRECLNCTNSYIIYLFYFIQATGIIITSYATSVNSQKLTWTGISLNMFASLLSIYEKQNNSILKKLLNDINLIKTGVYVDECELVSNVTPATNTINETV